MMCPSSGDGNYVKGLENQISLNSSILPMLYTFPVFCNVSGVLVTNWTQENTTCLPSDVLTVPVQSPSEQYWE